MKSVRTVGAAVGLLAFATASQTASPANWPSASFNLAGAVFDDGGAATGGFDFNIDSGGMPLPQFYNILIATSGGAMLPGSIFSSSAVCYNNRKKFVCAPGDNFVMSLEIGTPGEPGFDHFQLATYFAPNALRGNIGVLDPIYSYEIGCTQNGCFTRHITAGAIRWGALL